jgi:hypothetical protein
MVQPLRHLRHFLSHTFVLSSLLLISYGCNEPFSPKGPFEQRIVTYSVLNAQSDIQFVRMYLNYNPPGYDPNAFPSEQYDTSAQVVISAASQNFVFHDTLLGPSLHAFVSQSFRPQPGKAYVLTIASRFGNVSSTTTVPGHGDLAVPDQSTLLFPNLFPNANIDIVATLGSGTRGFLVRFILVYSLENDTTILQESEIPLSYSQDSGGQLTPQFPQLQRMVDPTPTISFPVTNYSQTIAQLTAQYGTRIIPKKEKFYLIQVDESAYNYYNVANGFRDVLSIRTDQPDYTNIQNGLGVFGSFNVDSLVIRF